MSDEKGQKKISSTDQADVVRDLYSHPKVRQLLDSGELELCHLPSYDQEKLLQAIDIYTDPRMCLLVRKAGEELGSWKFTLYNFYQYGWKKADVLVLAMLYANPSVRPLIDNRKIYATDIVNGLWCEKDVLQAAVIYADPDVRSALDCGELQFFSIYDAIKNSKSPPTAADLLTKFGFSSQRGFFKNTSTTGSKSECRIL